MSQGQGFTTIDKERRIGAALAVSMRIAGNKFGGTKYRYWHFDANAGCGWNAEVDVPGSPLVFWDNAARFLGPMRPFPFFCDRDKSAMDELQKRLARNPSAIANSILLPGDNEEGLRTFSETIRQSGERPSMAIGTLLVDPNGYWYRSANGVGAPVNAVTEFCREFPRIDVVLNLNVSFYGRFRKPLNLIPPSDVLQSLGKAHWLLAITGKNSGSNSRFLLAVGRNIATGAHAKLGMHDMKSDVGRLIMNKASGGGQMALMLSA